MLSSDIDDYDDEVGDDEDGDDNDDEDDGDRKPMLNMDFMPSVLRFLCTAKHDERGGEFLRVD